MERIDKLIAMQGTLSRSDVKKLIAKGRVTVNGRAIRAADTKIDPDHDAVGIDGKPFPIRIHLYLMLNKPKGYVSATDDKINPTVLDLVPPEFYRPGLFPAGRLDKDTTGFVLITDDGDFAHRILSPKNHIPKTYLATLRDPVTEEQLSEFEKGISIGKDITCRPAEARIVKDGEHPVTEVILREGMYHQIKRMFQAIGNEVIELQRIRMGNLDLDPDLGPGKCREILHKELLTVAE